MLPYLIAGAIGFGIGKLFEEGGETFGRGGITTNEGIIKSFLNSNKKVRVGNLETADIDDIMYLRNYRTFVAKRMGDKVKISSQKYSQTTSKITNRLKALAVEMGYSVEYVSEKEIYDFDKFAGGGGVGETMRDNYDALVGRVGDEYYFLDEIFKYKDGFKGATGTVVMPVSKAYYEYATSEDGILERYMDAMGEDEWISTLGLDREDFEDEDDLIKAIENGIYQLYYVGELNPFEEVGSDLEEQMRALPQFASSEEYPVFGVIGGGRIFGKDVVFDEIYNQELYDKIKQIEEYAEGVQAGKKGKSKAIYIPKRNIKTLTTTYGNTIKGKDLLDGAYTRRKDIRQDPKMVRTIFEEEEFAEFNNGGGVGNPSKKEMLDYLNMYFDYYSELRTIAIEEDNILTRRMLNSLDNEELQMAYDDAKYEIKADTQFDNGGGVGNTTAISYNGKDALTSYQKNNIQDTQKYIADNGTIIEFVAMNDRDSSSGMTFAITINGRGLYASEIRKKAMEVYIDEIAKYKNNYKYDNGGEAKKSRRRANKQTGRTDRSVDKTRVGKPVGYRFSNSLASKLRKDKYEAPTEKQIKKYIGKGIYKENRKNRSDKDRTIKL
jgi:hypothetical protein